jgi:hypothetical protein
MMLPVEISDTDPVFLHRSGRSGMTNLDIQVVR